MNSQLHQTEQTRSMPLQPSLRQRDPLFDFDVDPLVDADDPGFNSEFETDDSDLSDSDDDTGPEESEPTDFARSDIWLRALANHCQAEYVKQPKSTQIILTREVSKVFESYAQHGSAARLSASVMEFLEGGNIVSRPTKRVVEEDVFDVMGRQTGEKKKVTKRSLERAELRFAPLPKIGVDPREVEREQTEVKARRVDGGGKRKASVGSLGNENKRHASFMDGRHIGTRLNTEPATYQSDMAGIQVPLHPALTEKVPPHSNSDAMDIDTQEGARLLFRLHQDSSKTFKHPEPRTQQQPPTIPHSGLTCPRSLYSLTNDTETQDLLLGPEPAIPFNPLSSLKIIIPKAPNTTFPPAALAILRQILHLHAATATKQYHHLLDKYTLKPTPSHPDPPQPPAALFRLAIISTLHADLEHLFTPTLEHPFVIDPETRGLLRDLYGKSPGKLNPVEKSLVARMTGLDFETVEAWWDERMRALFPAEALRRWRRGREAEAVGWARLMGTY